MNAAPDRALPARSFGPLAVAALAALTGCGGCVTPQPAGQIPPVAPDGPQPAPEPAADAAPAAPPAARAPLSDEARRARLAAQRALLGRGPLIEDEAGNPPPSLAPLSDDALPAPADDELARLPGSSGRGAERHGAPPRIDGNLLGTFVPLEQPQALAGFYGALRNLAAGKDADGKVRVLVYGASHTEADIYPHYLRVYLQTRFGDGGHGFIHAIQPKRWYRHVDMGVRSTRHWLAEHAQRSPLHDDGFFGLAGLSGTTSKKAARSRVFHKNGTVASSYDVYYLQQPKGGTFDLFVDGKKAARISTRAASVGPGVHHLSLPEASHELELRPRGDGQVRLLGLVAEREGPGVVVDTLGIGGTRAANHLAWDEATWGEYLRRRDPALVVLAYGTNEATDEDQPIAAYAADLRRVLTRLRATAPQASCVLMGPGDFPRKTEDGGWAPRPRVRQIVEVQREVAREAGCAFWDMLTFMGGEGSMDRWVRSAPAMAREDHIHLTRRGYVRTGMMFTDALMAAYDQPATVASR